MMPVLALFLLSVGLVRTHEQEIGVEHTGKLCSSGECDSGCTIGAEITGITNFTTLADSDISFIREALNKHKVVYFHGAAHLFTPATQLEFASRLGVVDPDISRVPKYVEKGVHQSTHSVRHDQRTGMQAGTSVNTMVEANSAGKKLWKGEIMPTEVARLVREPGDPFAFGEGFHADVTFFPNPPVFTFLVGRELPGGGDDTIFIDVAESYRKLPAELKEEINGLNAVHHDSAGSSWTHPVVRTHPETGEQVLYANSHFTHEIKGYAKEEGKALLDRIFDHVEAEPKFRFKWTCDCGSTCPECMHVLIWDNRQLQHTATTEWARDPVYSGKRRELHRITISHPEQSPYYRPMASGSDRSTSKCDSGHDTCGTSGF